MIAARIQIQEKDLIPILNRCTGDDLWKRVLEETIDDNKKFLSILGNYVQFNSPFGAGVANLAGKMAVRQDLFRDPDEPVEIAADRSVEVASKIFSAAIDEFGDRGVPDRASHRTLALRTLKEASQFFGYFPHRLNEIVKYRIDLFTVDRLLDYVERLNPKLKLTVGQ